MTSLKRISLNGGSYVCDLSCAFVLAFGFSQCRTSDPETELSLREGSSLNIYPHRTRNVGSLKRSS